MITFKNKGDFSKTTRFLEKAKKPVRAEKLKKYGEEGVAALMSATPQETGLTANSWYYEIKTSKNSVVLSFCNSNIQNGVPIAIIVQLGHGTRNGGWVEGRDYINPTLQPIFDKISHEVWREVVGT